MHNLTLQDILRMGMMGKKKGEQMSTFSNFCEKIQLLH